jgi:hypothetical protein
MCPDCGQDPSAGESREAPAPRRVRRKVRKQAPGKPVAKEHKRKARALMIFVIAWVVLLGILAIMMRKGEPGGVPADDLATLSGAEIEDQRLIQEQLERCRARLTEFLAASEIGTRALHVVRAPQTVPRMARVRQFNPIYASTGKLEVELFGVIRTPVGRAIESLWKQEDGGRIEAVFFEEEGEWKIDWDAFARAGTESWPLFLAGRGPGEGEFRLLARERIGANGQDDEFIGLVLYSTRPGHPEEALAPSPEVRVPRASPMGRQIVAAFAARQEGVGPFGSQVVKHDPDEMIRLRVRVRREGEDERVFHLDELFACHWLELPPPKAAEE